MTPGPVLLKRNVRSSKYDPLVDEVELLEANPNYAHVRLQNGTETTVSTRHLAPLPPIKSEAESVLDDDDSPTESDSIPADETVVETQQQSSSVGRNRRIPERLKDYYL